MNDREHASVVEVMHRGVITCAAESSALAAAHIMAAHRIHCVVVAGADGVPRLVTDADIASAIYDDQLDILSAGELSRPSPLLRPDDTLAFALERMHESGITHAVVVGPSLRLLGMVSVLDVMDWLLQSVSRSPQRNPRAARCPAEARNRD